MSSEPDGGPVSPADSDGNEHPAAPGTARLRFPKGARLTTTWEFRRVRERGRSWGGKFIVLGVLNDAPPDGSGLARIGFITSKRVGGAVVRNTVRRRLREAVRATRPRLRAGCWLVLVARHTAAKAGAAELAREWLRLAERASILIGTPSSS